LFLHSAFPTLAADSVFLGPDSYRFADFIAWRMNNLDPGATILDYGAGAGVGGICAARQRTGCFLTLADINPKALFLSSVNADAAGIGHRAVEASSPTELPGNFDLIVTHPPFMMDDQGRAYRDGGDLYGARLALEWVVGGSRKLRPGGQLILHTGVSIVDGRDVLLEHLIEELEGPEWALDYRELDPDIFSEDLDQPAYAKVERIAAVGLVVTRRQGQSADALE
jgi:methylase of polypeptide subunit release factors